MRHRDANNDQRKARAEKALKRYAPNEPQSTAAIDLLTDLLHLLGYDYFADLAEIASGHYDEEIGT